MPARLLPVACAFHSPLRRAGAAAARRAAEHDCALEPPRIPVFSNTTAAPYPDDPAAIAGAPRPSTWSSPVEFVARGRGDVPGGARIFVEVGPRAVLSGSSAGFSAIARTSAFRRPARPSGLVPFSTASRRWSPKGPRSAPSGSTGAGPSGASSLALDEETGRPKHSPPPGWSTAAMRGDARPRTSGRTREPGAGDLPERAGPGPGRDHAAPITLSIARRPDQRPRRSVGRPAPGERASAGGA